MNINKYINNLGLKEIKYKEFYRDIFPIGSFEKKGVYEDTKPNGIIVEVTDEKKEDGRQLILRHTLTDELDKLDEIMTRNNFCLMSPISYIGKSRHSDNARFIYAMAIDIDGIETENNIEYLFFQLENGHNMTRFIWGLPKPTYIVSSGTGLHLYYVFEKPIPLFSNIVKELEKMKKRLTWQAWTQGATNLVDNVQYESLFQGFRMVGTKTKKNTKVKAFRYGEKVTLEYLNKYIPEDYQIKNIQYKSNLTLAKAKEKYPQWYEKRIINKQPKGTWKCKKDLYDWWIRKIYQGANQGHRYWCLMTLSTYAKKCGVDYETLEKDALDLIPFLNSKGDLFTVEDAMHALEAFNDNYITYPIDTIVTRTNIQIQKNKRNGRKQNKHMEVMRAIQEIVNPDWRNKYGRPKGSGIKKEIVEQWRNQNPSGKKADCIRETGLTKPTVYKWW